MKYVILRCEDLAPSATRATSLLDGAKVLHLQQLAQAGAAGLIRARSEQGILDRFGLHRALLGLAPGDPQVSGGQCYAAALNLHAAPGETIWCCDLVTQRDGRIVDASAGHVTTKEAEVLVHALDERFGSETRRWEVGQGSHHLLIVRDPLLGSDGLALHAPDLLIGQLWARQLPKGSSGEALQSLINQTAQLLELHPINGVRTDLGENPANMIWLWGASDHRPGRAFSDRTGQRGAVSSSSLLLRGLARTQGLAWKEGPASFQEPAIQRWMKTIRSLVEAHDVVYLHAGIDSGDPVERLCAMERLDQLILAPLTEWLPTLGSWRLLTVVDRGHESAVPFVAIGTGLPRQPVAHLSVEALAASPLAFGEPDALFPWFTQEGAAAATAT